MTDMSHIKTIRVKYERRLPIHCNYNDHSSPDLTVSNVVKYAGNMGLRLISFAEHVRKHLTGFQDILTKYNILLAANISLK
jgi:hypothetical protein